MHKLTDQQLADALLTVVGAIPTDVPWNVVPIHDLGLVLAWDSRDEANAGILKALAAEQGEVVAAPVDHIKIGGEPLVAALIRPQVEPEEAAESLRATYLVATTPDHPIEEEDPDATF